MLLCLLYVCVCNFLSHVSELQFAAESAWCKCYFVSRHRNTCSWNECKVLIKWCEWCLWGNLLSENAVIFHSHGILLQCDQHCTGREVPGFSWSPVWTSSSLGERHTVNISEWRSAGPRFSLSSVSVLNNSKVTQPERECKHNNMLNCYKIHGLCCKRTVYCWQRAQIVNNDTRETHKQQQVVSVWLTWMVNPCIPCCDCPELLCVEMDCVTNQDSVWFPAVALKFLPNSIVGKSPNKAVRFHSFQKQSLQWSNEQIKTERGAGSKDSDWRSMVFTWKAQKSPEVSFFISCRQLATHWWRNVSNQTRPDQTTAASCFHCTSLLFKSRGVSLSFFLCTCKNNVKRKDGCVHDCSDVHVLLEAEPHVFSKWNGQLCLNQHACVEQWAKDC